LRVSIIGTMILVACRLSVVGVTTNSIIVSKVLTMITVVGLRAGMGPTTPRIGYYQDDSTHRRDPYTPKWLTCCRDEETCTSSNGCMKLVGKTYSSKSSNHVTGVRWTAPSGPIECAFEMWQCIGIVFLLPAGGFSGYLTRKPGYYFSRIVNKIRTIVNEIQCTK
jgi:hypothetical protein